MYVFVCCIFFFIYMNYNSQSFQKYKVNCTDDSTNMTDFLLGRWKKERKNEGVLSQESDTEENKCKIWRTDICVWKPALIS